MTGVNASDLANAILGTSVNNLPGSDRIDGGAGDDILFGDAIHFAGINGEGYAAIKQYVAGKLSAGSVTDAQVHDYITDHASEFDQSSNNDKADVLIGGMATTSCSVRVAMTSCSAVPATTSCSVVPATTPCTARAATIPCTAAAATTPCTAVAVTIP